MKSYARYFCFLWIISFFAALMLGCAAKEPSPNARLEDVLTQGNGTKQEVRAINEKLFSSVKSAPTLKDYVIGEGDLLQVSVFEAQDLKTEGRVGARGFMSLPLIGAVQVKDLTTEEAERKIEQLYRAKYLQNPHVNIFVKEQVSGKITLMGAFKKTGTFPYLARQNLFEAMALGEGLTETAGKIVQVRRGSKDSERPETFLVDLDVLVMGGGEQANIGIKPGDVIYVPEAGMVYVDGAVRKPGNYPIKKKMSIQEAIIAAGGFRPYADQASITLVRIKANGEKPDIVKLSLDDIHEKPSHNIDIIDRDIVFVGTNKIAQVFSSLNIMGPYGGVGLNYGNQ
jgi:polysaccharide export outer membrane protein